MEGELRDGRDAHILRGIDSVRMYLKQANEAASQALLAGETLAALAVLAGRARYPSSALQRAWKLLLRNQPHDSISGCSVDDVHTEMLVRYRKVEQLADRIATESVAALAGETATWAPERPARDWVSVVNLLPSARRVLVDLPLARELAGTGRLVAETADGELPAQRVGRGAAAVSVDVPGFGATTLRLRKWRSRDSHGRTTADAATGPVGTTSIENEHYRVSAEPDGTFTITELASGRSIAGVGRLEDVADRGDEYTFCPVDGDAGWSSTSCRARARLITAGPVVAELEVTLRGALPAGLSRDRRRRVGRVPFRVRTVARLVAGIDRVELRTVVENAARDHRLRVIVPAPDAARTEPIRAEGHFAVLRRPARPPVPSNPAGWAELPQPMQHTTGFVAAGSTVVHAKGLPEYEAIERADGGLDLALTLLRCVGWLSRDDLATRSGGAGPAIETPDAQCLGRQTFEYAVELSGDRDDPALVRSSADYRQAVRVGPPSADPGAILAVDGDVAFAALKGAEAGDGVVLRIYNPGATPAEVRVRAPGQVRRVRLDETPMDGQGAVVEAPTVLEAGEIGSFWVAADGPRRDLE